MSTEDGRESNIDLFNPASRECLSSFNPAIPPEWHCFSRSRLVTIAVVLLVTSITYNFPVFIPHPASRISLSILKLFRILRVKISKSRSRRSSFIPHPAIKFSVISLPRHIPPNLCNRFEELHVMLRRLATGYNFGQNHVETNPDPALCRIKAPKKKIKKIFSLPAPLSLMLFVSSLMYTGSHFGSK